MDEQKDKYTAQKKYLSQKKQLRVWADTDKYERLKHAASANGDSIYSIITRYIDAYLDESEA
ncbi:hypothetical protein [Ructibacterium gallinarum]|uniref:Uncharacterized protein n=1 Tax=Ructibacterium gallinarum TaxID=2779355 RepID=A0A9D5RC35_9FIRM|nr:hypothetical protein [Ructibacterium gallinarum]MBE5040618.1 hypothetical protein [Ructibacterium gallinarum]